LENDGSSRRTRVGLVVGSGSLISYTHQQRGERGKRAGSLPGLAFTGIRGLSRSTPPFLENSDRDFFEPLYLTNYYGGEEREERGKKRRRKKEREKSNFT
jgi:hypothetical protein